MHYLPDTALGTKDHRSPQSDRGSIHASANLGSFPHQRYYVGELGSYALRYDLEPTNSPSLRSDALRSRVSAICIPPAHGREEGVGEGYVFPVGEQRLYRVRGCLLRTRPWPADSARSVCQHRLRRTSSKDHLHGRDVLPYLTTLRSSYAIHPSAWKVNSTNFALSRPRPPRGRPVGPGLRGTMVLALLPPG